MLDAQKITAALRQRFGTPEAVLKHLGIDQVAMQEETTMTLQQILDTIDGLSDADMRTLFERLGETLDAVTASQQAIAGQAQDGRRRSAHETALEA